MLWSVVSEKVYQGLKLSDKVLIMSCDFGHLKKHVTVLYRWMDEQTSEINEFKYEYDLTEEPPGR